MEIGDFFARFSRLDQGYRDRYNIIDCGIKSKLYMFLNRISDQKAADIMLQQFQFSEKFIELIKTSFSCAKDMQNQGPLFISQKIHVTDAFSF